MQDHLPSKHQQLAKWNPTFFLERAQKVGSSTKELISHILEKKQYPEQAYKSCRGVLSLEQKVGTARLNKACGIACEHQRYNYRHVIQILENGMDLLEELNPPTSPLPKHNNIRGKNYYS